MAFDSPGPQGKGRPPGRQQGHGRMRSDLKPPTVHPVSTNWEDYIIRPKAIKREQTAYLQHEMALEGMNHRQDATKARNRMVKVILVVVATVAMWAAWSMIRPHGHKADLFTALSKMHNDTHQDLVSLIKCVQLSPVHLHSLVSPQHRAALGHKLRPRLSQTLSDATHDQFRDPYLRYRPAFAYSLPVQTLLQGITLTLLSVLLTHILFTTQYHFPLSKFNYTLQLSGILLVLGSTIGNIVLTLKVQQKSSTQWPYMLNYVGVYTPPSSWGQGRKGAWYFLQSLCNGMVHVSVSQSVEAGYS